MNERGNASLAVLGVCLLLGLFILGLGDTAVLLLARSQAQVAADAAALAAASELIPGASGDPTSEAARFAAANGGSVVFCLCAKGAREAVVKVRVPVQFLLINRLGAGEVGALAKADVQLSESGREIARSG